MASADEQLKRLTDPSLLDKIDGLRELNISEYFLYPSKPSAKEVPAWKPECQRKISRFRVIGETESKMPISTAVSTHENVSYSFVNGQFVAVRKIDTPPSTKEVSSEEDESSDGSLEIIPESMKALSLFPVKPENALTRGTDSVSQIASPFRPKFIKPSSQKAKVSKMAWDSDRDYHESFFATETSTNTANEVHIEEIRTTPFFSADVLAETLKQKADSRTQITDILPQYGLLAKVTETFDDADESEKHRDDLVDAFGEPVKAADKRMFVNMNAPWSAFICGSQGSGKSHTLSCILENALITSNLGKLPCPMAGIVFHYDKFTGFTSTQVCEAAYLASSGIPVKVLVSPSNRWRMEQAYGNLPGFPKDAKKPVVVPLLLNETQLNVERMMKLMAVDEKDGKMALYMESVCRILRSMAMANQGRPGLDFDQFTKRLELEALNDGQKAMLSARLQLLKSFLHLPGKPGTATGHQQKPHFPDTKKGREQERNWWVEEDARMRAKIAKSNIWSFEPGTLTIVDLSCPFVDEGAACAMFNISLALFLEDREKAGRIVALDEAHKFMTATDSSSQFTESLLSVIRQQRHLATRVIIATQEPTISPALLDLSSMTIVHRFTSPSWLAALRSHLAGVSSEGDASKRDVAQIFKQIVNLGAGQALLLSPSAMLGVEDGQATGSRMKTLGTGYVKIQVRKRLTADGGRSILAT